MECIGRGNNGSLHSARLSSPWLRPIAAQSVEINWDPYCWDEIRRAEVRRAYWIIRTLFLYVIVIFIVNISPQVSSLYSTDTACRVRLACSVIASKIAGRQQGSAGFRPRPAEHEKAKGHFTDQYFHPHLSYHSRLRLFIRLAHLVWEPSVLVAASVVCCLSVVCLSACPASDLGNYARCVRNFVTSIRNRGLRAWIWRQILH